MSYIGQGPFQEFTNPPTKDSFTGDGSTTTFDLNSEVPSGSQNALEVYVNNVRQEPGTGKAFTLGVDGSGDMKRITFSAAPASGAAIYVINDKTNSTIVAPLQNDLNGTELILDADGDTSITADTDDRIDFKISNVEHIALSNSSGDTVIKPMVDAKDIIFQQYDGNKVLEINDGGYVGVGGNSNAPGEIRIFEDTDLGSHYTGFKSGNNTASVVYVLPLADGSSGQALATDGSGTLSWTTVSANTPSSADGQALGSASLEWSDLFLADGGTIQLGNDQDVTLTHVADTGILLNGANVIQFRDSGLTVGSNADGDLDIVSDGTNVDSINIESAGGITLDAGTAGSGIVYEDDGTEMARLYNSSSDVILETKVSDKDFSIKGNDGGSAITALTLDMSAAGAATFNDKIIATELDISGDVDIDGTLETDALSIASTTITSTAAEINLIDGGTSRGTTALADGDGMLVNDAGTMRMTNVTAVKTYMQSGLTSNSILDADSDTKIQVEESSDEDTIRYDIAGAEVATQTARGFEFTAVGGFVMNQTTNSQTFTIAATENAIVGGPIALSGTITVEGTLAVV